MRRVADPASPRYQNPARGHRRFRRRRLPGPASAVTKEAAAAAAAAKVSPADVEPRPHRPTHTHFNSLARRRAYHGSAPCDAPPRGGTTEAPPRASSDWPPRCHHHVAGSWQGVCVCLCVCVCVRGLLCHSYPRRSQTWPAWPSTPGSSGRAPGVSRTRRMRPAPYIRMRRTGVSVQRRNAHAANPGLAIS